MTARESDLVLEFSAAALVTNPSAALTGDAQVGEAPVGLVLFHHDTSLAVADSNRFQAPGATANLAIVTVGASGQLGLRGYIPTGTFPRDIAVSPDGRTLIVSNNGSGQVETVQTADLP